MPHAIRFHQTGGPEVLSWEEVPMPEPAAGEVLIRQTAISLDFVDCYFRNGLYKAPELPAIPGFSGAGVVEAIGEGVDGVEPGQRVAYISRGLGAYAEYRTLRDSELLVLPDSIPDVVAAATLVRGLTAYFLVNFTYPIGKTHRVLVHAAAGGLGTLLVPWAKHRGAPMVIGTAGGPEKCALAEQVGCDYVIDYDSENIAARVAEITNELKTHVVYDGVGQRTFEASLDSLARFGALVSFGQSSGPVPPVDLGILREKGSLWITRPTLFDHIQELSMYTTAAAELFMLIQKRILPVHIHQTYRLRDAAKAHRDLEGRRTKGASVLVVE